MKKTDKRRRERIMFGAPIVATAVLAAGCAGRVYENPGRPTDVPPETTATTAPGETPPPADSGELQDPPKDGEGKVVVQEDGSCLYVFPYPKDDHCPPDAHCNPGPPREPLRVKCPDGTKP